MTYHPAAKILNDWHPDGKSLIYSTSGFAGLGRQLQLFTISKQSPMPKQLPVPYGNNGAISPDGLWLAYTPHSRDERTWKRYRGGMASDIWLVHLESQTAKQITDFAGTDSLPMWHEKTVYYLSDAGAENRLNIWAYDTTSGERRQVTRFEDYDCKWPAIGPGPDGQGEIVLQNGSMLYLVNLESDQATAVEITIPGDRPQLRRKKVDAAKFIVSQTISPTGKRVAVEARGDIWSLPAKKGPLRNLTRSSGAAERFPAWSPDGRWIAYFSDKTGEYELYVCQSDSRGDTKQLTRNGSCYRYHPTWSPDSKLIAFSDKAGRLYLYSFDTDSTQQVDTDPYATPLNVSWSHNSEWLAYARTSDTKAPTSSIWLYHVRDGAKRMLTSGYFPDANPTFDRKGNYLFFTSNRAFNAPKYEDLGTSFVYADTELLLALPLRSDVKNPFLPKSDEELWGKERDAARDGDDDDEHSDHDPDKHDEHHDEQGEDHHGDNGDREDHHDVFHAGHEANHHVTPGSRRGPDEQDPKRDAKQKDDAQDKAAESEKPDQDEAPQNLVIDFEDIERRAFQIPVPQGKFGPIAVNHKGQLIFARLQTGLEEEDGQAPAVIQLFDLDDDEHKAKDVVEGTASFEISSDGKKLLVVKQKQAYVVDAAPKQELKDAVPQHGMVVMVDPRDEWRQMFVDAWRMERDFFYDPNMHGVDWPAVRTRYEAMLDDCVSRRDVGFVIGEMIAELNVGHAYYREGDVEEGPAGNVGLLGCRFEVDSQAYKVAELYEGAPWDVDARNPLRTAGVHVGEFVLAVNGTPLGADQNAYAALQNLADSIVTLTVSQNAQIGDDDDRQVSVTALADDADLRFRGEIERQRKYVDEKSGGKIGYIYVVNTGVPGQNDLVRQYYAQLNKPALIIDDRWNGGGQIPTRFIELLNRPVTNYWAVRDGRDWTWPPDAHHGPKCMLINGMAGSGGDMFPALFKQAGLGKLIGMRTWGGLVGISGNPGLIDGAAVTVPTFAYYELDGTWGIEGHGVDPDIPVIDDPEKMVGGIDPQLDAAIAHLSRELETKAYKQPARPSYPDRSKSGIAPVDQ